MTPDPLDYRVRAYRVLHRQADLVHFQVAVKETDLDIGVRREVYTPELVARAADLVRAARRDIEDYIAAVPLFATTLTPLAVPPTAPAIVRAMAEAAAVAGVGPMAAVAGAIADAVGRGLARFSRDVIVENGGDIYLRSKRLRTIGVFAGDSPFTGRLGIEVGGGGVEGGDRVGAGGRAARAEAASAGSLGICTSSGTVGHSLSFGRADAAVVLAKTAALADAVATATGNRVHCPDDLEPAVAFACALPGVIGAIAILGDKMAAKGQMAIVSAGAMPQ